MRRVILAFASVMTMCFAVSGARPYVVVLGVGQDAGVPQIGCDSPFCRKAWADKRSRRMVSSIALVDPATGGRWIFDATPDLPEQFELLKNTTGDRTNRLDGIFLTHAHIGHYTGLMYLGRESMSTRDVRVYAMPRMKRMLETNAPWSQLISIRNISLFELNDGVAVDLAAALSVEAFLVPHRDEFSETAGFRIRSGKTTLVFIPDIDKWDRWAMPLSDVVRSANILLIDGTFYADGEIARPMAEVPHPFVTETMTLLKGLSPADRAKVNFIHFNHTNPLVQGNRSKLDEVKRQGFSVAAQGQKFSL